MAAKILNVLLSLVLSIANVFLAPINTILTNFVPDLTEHLNYFTQGIGLFFTTKLSWFAYMIPPHTKSLIFIYITFLIAYYTVAITLHGVLWLLNVVKKLPFT